tara:strand:- start:405 stop:1145 length:741 start_codon:yes stop_codon:yes gene_type:complete
MLENKNIVVTGSLQGIGKQSVKSFAELGANVIACSHYYDDGFLEFCKEIASQNQVEITPLKADFTDDKDVKEVGKIIYKMDCNIDGLTNIAGITKDAIFQMTSMQDVRAIYEVNLFSTMLLTQLVTKKMLKNNSGSIVNVSSISAIDGVGGQLAYSSSKASILGMTKTLSRELGASGIRVNAVAPGVIDTEMNKNVPSEILDERLENTSLKRMGDPKEVSDVIAFLLSDMSSYINGQVIRIDGGMA